VAGPSAPTDRSGVGARGGGSRTCAPAAATPDAGGGVVTGPAGTEPEEVVEVDRRGVGGRTALVAAGVLALVVALFVIVLASSDPATERAEESPLFGRLAPATAGRTIDGGTFDIDDYRGRWVMVNFFASWCVPCIEEHPELQAFDESHRATGDAVLVSVTFDNEADAAREFFERQGGSWPVIDDPENRIGVAYGVAQVPETFVIAPSGVVVHRFAGGVTRAELDGLIEAFERGAG
jgi:cytochrome c biogenesis protein CcmG, thiol:disulfide interchange protein DsbE